MQIGFSPISYNQPKKQTMNFGALNIQKIIKNDAQAEIFAEDVAYNRVKKTEENVKDLLEAIKIASKNKGQKMGVLSYLEEVRDEFWKIKQ